MRRKQRSEHDQVVGCDIGRIRQGLEEQEDETNGRRPPSCIFEGDAIVGQFENENEETFPHVGPETTLLSAHFAKNRKTSLIAHTELLLNNQHHWRRIDCEKPQEDPQSTATVNGEIEQRPDAGADVNVQSAG